MSVSSTATQTALDSSDDEAKTECKAILVCSLSFDFISGTHKTLLPALTVE